MGFLYVRVRIRFRIRVGIRVRIRVGIRVRIWKKMLILECLDIQFFRILAFSFGLRSISGRTMIEVQVFLWGLSRFSRSSEKKLMFGKFELWFCEVRNFLVRPNTKYDRLEFRLLQNKLLKTFANYIIVLHIRKKSFKKINIFFEIIVFVPNHV